MIGELGRFVGTADLAKQRCAFLAKEQFHLPHAPSWRESWTTVKLKALVASPDGDCSSLATKVSAVDLFPGE